MSIRKNLSQFYNKHRSDLGVTSPKKVYVFPQLADAPIIDLAIVFAHADPPANTPGYKWGFLRTTHKPHLADFVLVPHEVAKFIKNKDYVRQLKKLSSEIPLVVFNTGDKSPNLGIKNALQIRTFLHPWENQSNKVVVPYPSKAKKLEVRGYSKTPTVSFMGYVPKLGLGSLFGGSPRGLIYPIKSSVFLNRQLVSFRLHSMSEKLSVRVCKRSSFSGYSASPYYQELQTEYERDLIESDYVFCPRGFGNTSIRFFETLSAGRIPITIDTNSPLPTINSSNSWGDYVLQLNMFENWEQKILEHWSSQVSSDTYALRQLRTSQLFHLELQYEHVLKNLFVEYLL